MPMLVVWEPYFENHSPKRKRAASPKVTPSSMQTAQIPDWEYNSQASLQMQSALLFNIALCPILCPFSPYMYREAQTDTLKIPI